MKKLLYILLIIAILGVGIGGAFYFMKNKPRPTKRPSQEHALLVETTPIKRSDINITIKAMGTVKPSKSIELTSRVAGEILQTTKNFTPGTLFKKGETLLKIDSIDYQLIVTQKESDVKKAEYELTLENAQGVIAAQELEFLGESIKNANEALLLRKPNLQAAQAKLEAAHAALQKAKLDLSRTTLKAPFNASLQKIHVNLGSSVRSGDKLVTLVNSDTFWVEALIPIEQINQITFPSKADVYSNNKSSYGATAIGLFNELEESTRMAKILLEVQDPLSLKRVNQNRAPLFIGDYVDVTLQGKMLHNCIKIPRYAVHGANTIWIMTAQKKLRSHPITIVYQERDFIYAASSDINDGELLITSTLAMAVEGMALREMNNE